MVMETYIGFENAHKAKGLVVVVDVLRAATVAAYLLDRGCIEIHPVRTVEEAFAKKALDPSVLLVGEDINPIPGFDYNNSPSEIAGANLAGRIAVHRSTAGTQGLKLAVNASVVVFGSFVVFDALVAYIQKNNPAQLSIVCTTDHPDDLLFARCLESRLSGIAFDFAYEVSQLRHMSHVDRFFDSNPSFPEQDFWLSLELSKFHFVPVMKGEVLVKSN